MPHRYFLGFIENDFQRECCGVRVQTISTSVPAKGMHADLQARIALGRPYLIVLFHLGMRLQHLSLVLLFYEISGLFV